jgi:hypothetical protein
VATSLGLPLEVYDLTRKVTWLALLLLAVNLALVLYLAITKRLFGIRGGGRAYRARLREQSVLEEAVVAASAASTRPAPDRDPDGPDLDRTDPDDGTDVEDTAPPRPQSSAGAASGEDQHAAADRRPGWS